MIVKSVSYGRTINIGNYESVRVEVTVEGNGFDTYEELMAEAKRLIAEEVIIIRQNIKK